MTARAWERPTSGTRPGTAGHEDQILPHYPGTHAPIDPPRAGVKSQAWSAGASRFSKPTRERPRISGDPPSERPRGSEAGAGTIQGEGKSQNPEVTRDELDALTCALVARDYLRGDTMTIGDPQEGLMVLPKKGSRVEDGGPRFGEEGARTFFLMMILDLVPRPSPGALFIVSL